MFEFHQGNIVPEESATAATVLFLTAATCVDWFGILLGSFNGGRVIVSRK